MEGLVERKPTLFRALFSNDFAKQDGSDVIYTCRAGTSSDLERWLYAFEKASGHHELEESGAKKVVELLEKKYDGKPIRYNLHKWPEEYYVSMERKPMPGRPTSGTLKPAAKLGAGDSIRGSRTPISPRAAGATTVGRGRGTPPMGGSTRALPEVKAATRPAGGSTSLMNVFKPPEEDKEDDAAGDAAAAAAAAAATTAGAGERSARGQQQLTTKAGTKIVTKNPRLTSLANRSPPVVPPAAKGGADKSPLSSPRGAELSASSSNLGRSSGTIGRSSGRILGAAGGGGGDSSAADRLKLRLEKKKGEMVAERERRNTLALNESEAARAAAVAAATSGGAAAASTTPAPAAAAAPASGASSARRFPASNPPSTSEPAASPRRGGVDPVVAAAQAAELEELKNKVKTLEESLDKETKVFF